MKLLISNQHGAIVMALMPFLYGMLLGRPIWQHAFFLLAWFSLYLMTYPFLNLFKGRNLELYIKWSWIYFFACVIFAIPVLIYNWHIALFVAAMLPLVLVSIYYVKQKDERAFLNDLVGIIILRLPVWVPIISLTEPLTTIFGWLPYIQVYFLSEPHCT